jgi:5-methylcytosine-specific restriction endonuclease McrA
VLVALFALHGSRNRVAAEIGIDAPTLGAYLKARKRGALRATCEAVQPKRPGSAYRSPESYTTNYPPDAKMIALMGRFGTFSKVANEIGVSCGSLRDYLSRRPALDRAMRAHHASAAHRDGRTREPQRRFKERPWTTTPRRSSWVRHHAAEANLAGQYAAILGSDPCSYCGGSCAEIDHIESVARGGSGEFDNLTASCRHCNRAKRDRPFLYHMLRRAEGWA